MHMVRKSLSPCTVGTLDNAGFRLEGVNRYNYLTFRVVGCRLESNFKKSLTNGKIHVAYNNDYNCT